MYTLGINAAFHDPAACLVKDGRIIAAAEEERFNRVKHGKRPVPFSAWELPFLAIDFCLAEAGIALRDVEQIGYSFDPHLLLEGPPEALSLPVRPSAVQPKLAWGSPWDPLFLCYVLNSPLQLVDGAPHHLKRRFHGASADFFQWHFVPHHLAHAASAFHASPYDSAAIMTLDGRGELATTSYAVGHDASIRWMGEVRMPHSLGLLYEQVTSYLGFLRSSDEHKVMALASYGKPRYIEEFRRMIQLGGNGSYTIAPARLDERFGPARAKGGPIEPRHLDIARSLQQALEETVVELASWLRKETAEGNLTMAGGVALNCVMNARLLESGVFEQIWVQPAAGDAGTALGAALWVDAKARQNGKSPNGNAIPSPAARGLSTRGGSMDHVYFGPAFGDDEIERFLRWSKLDYEKLDDVAEASADMLAEGKIIGWFQGRMEFGPRALGARSILASPIDPSMQARLNEIKGREDFQPVAPVVLEEEAANWFKNAGRSPFMLFVYDVREEKAERIPAVRHADATARIQTICRHQHPLYYDLIKAFERRTGVPVLINTSFNTRGEPIVCTPRDAVESFWTSPVDALVIGSFALVKESSPKEGASPPRAANAMVV